MLDETGMRALAPHESRDAFPTGPGLMFDALRVPDEQPASAARRMLRQQSMRWFGLLAGVELLLLLLSPWLAIHTRFPADPEGVALAQAELPVRAVLFASVVWLTMVALGLYQRHSRGARDDAPGIAARVMLAMAVGGVALMALYYVLPETQVGRGVLLLSLLYGTALLIVSRLVFSRVVDDAALKRRVLILGAGDNAAQVLARLREVADLTSVVVVGLVPMAGDRSVVAPELVVRPRGSLLDYAFAEGVDEIVVGPDDRRGTLPMAELLACRLRGVSVLELEAFCERELGKVALELVRPSCFVYSQRSNASVLRRVGKRLFDIVGASVLLLCLWPLAALVALAIWIESRGRGPIFYVQERVGENDQPFPLVKFRSMRTDAEQDGVARWASADDDRVTRTGRIIRKLRLDEIPQLWNVLKGEMSIVGPRPERPQFVEQFKRRVRYYGLRHCVRPGLTGWAQLRFPYGASEEDAVEKLRYDLYYVKNHGFHFDLMVLLQTVEVVLFRRGSR